MEEESTKEEEFDQQGNKLGKILTFVAISIIPLAIFVLDLYNIKPDPSMLQQASKASADAAIGLSADSGAIETTVKQAGLAVNGYLCLMRYEHAGESKADCCFWIAKILRILSETMPKEWEGLVEHCEMLSYAFCELGVRYLDELNEKNNHAGELQLLHEEMDVRTR